jgi:hypothetical protein
LSSIGPTTGGGADALALALAGAADVAEVADDAPGTSSDRVGATGAGVFAEPPPHAVAVAMIKDKVDLDFMADARSAIRPPRPCPAGSGRKRV